MKVSFKANFTAFTRFFGSLSSCQEKPLKGDTKRKPQSTIYMWFTIDRVTEYDKIFGQSLVNQKGS